MDKSENLKGYYLYIYISCLPFDLDFLVKTNVPLGGTK